MKQEKVLSYFILSEFVLGILATISYYSMEPFLPSSLRTYPAPDGIAAFRFGATLLWALWIAVVVTTIIAAQREVPAIVGSDRRGEGKRRMMKFSRDFRQVFGEKV